MPQRPSSSAASAATRSVSAPYSRRPTGQPKSTRQQFSACGACRMRRVRCDLKDLPMSGAGPTPSCSNCKERGLKCVDEFADVKAVKLLRRGRRLQQVELIYGKTTSPDSCPTPQLTRGPSVIPQLDIQFFSSAFWRWFTVQRPILDPNEFSARYIAHANGSHPIGADGAILAMLLVVWASSFGLDERGLPIQDSEDTYPQEYIENSRHTRRSNSNTVRPADSTRKDSTDLMLREVLDAVDLHGLMRRPTWDGVRVLLLLLPLLEEFNPLDRATMEQAAFHQAHAICTLSSGSAIPMSPFSDETSIRARLFWYAHLYDGILSGVRGVRPTLDADDLESFQSDNSFSSRQSHPDGFANSPISSTFSTSHSFPDVHPALDVTTLFSVPLHISALCRQMQGILTGPKAVRQIEASGGLSIDSQGLKEIWDGFGRCWQKLEGVKHGGLASGDVDPMVDRFVSAWQIFIFECHNLIREALKHHASSGSSSPASPFSPVSPHAPSFPANSTPPLAVQLYNIANRECHCLLPFIVSTIKRHLSIQCVDDPADVAGLFKWDTGLVRDGVYYAADLLAESAECHSTPDSPSAADHHVLAHMKQDPDALDHTSWSRQSMRPVSSSSENDDAVRVCLAAIAHMKWTFAKNHDRDAKFMRLWHDNQMRPQGEPLVIQNQFADSEYATPQHPTSPIFFDPNVYGVKQVPHALPRLSLGPTMSRPDSAPNTACSTDGSSSGWPSYTPPSTSTSVTSAGMPSMSGNNSPIFPLAPVSMIQQFKNDADAFYQVASDMDHFSFNVPSNNGYHHPRRSASGTPLRGPPTPSYLDFPPNMTGNDDMHACAQFGDDCSGGAFYH